MNKVQMTHRERAVTAAVGSVRAEGLNPSAKTQKRLKDYAQGKITATELRTVTLREIKEKSE
jgi:cell filamentation protein